MKLRWNVWPWTCGKIFEHDIRVNIEPWPCGKIIEHDIMVNIWPWPYVNYVNMILG